jgi:hypothetical protein
VQLANKALDEVRRDYWNQLRQIGDQDAAKRFKDARWVLRAPRGANQPGGMKGPALGRRDGREKLGAVRLLR